MANTIMTAKNTFAEGLIMDFAPDNTQATCMTSALNATLLTFNGNEMSLQNDMGNGRVETAYLPEGYVPVGTCEFGDIIYIVSYNPITKKSQIGCFPSPERNISSEELYENGTQGYQSLSYTDFQETNNGILTGQLKNTSVKKVLIDTKKLNPGDKYIIYTDTEALNQNLGYLSDFGRINGKVNESHNTLPENVKLHVVSIEDSGKITYLDTTTKWYDIGDLKYYISTQKIGTGEKDLDSYRNLIQSNWSIFSSKVSGKLAILAELEMIDTFSCSYDLEYIENTIDTELLKYKKYKLYLCSDYTSSKNIKLPYICLTRASFDNSLTNEMDKEAYTIPTNLSDKTVYYYGVDGKLKTFEDTSEITASNSNGWTYELDEQGRIYIGDVTIPYQQRDSANKDWSTIKSKSFVYTLEITPTMDYGRLDHLAVQLVIDFNKIGTGEISLNTWKYHNSGVTSILTYGIEAYPKPNWEVSAVIMQFYDNQGLIGEYLLNDKKYYSGVFTEYFGLDGERVNSRFTNHNSLKGELIQHKGEKVDNIPDNIEDGNYITENGITYINDASTLYSGLLYGVKIIVEQKHTQTGVTAISNPEYRWYWTNPMYNEYYYSVQDFKELKFELVLNGEALFETTPYYQWKQKELNNLSVEYNTTEEWKTQSANAQYIGYGKEHNINMYVNAGLQNNYDCFNLHGFDINSNIGDIKNINLDIYLSKSEIRYTIPENLYEFSGKEGHVSEANYLRLVNQTNVEGGDEVADDFSTYLENPSSLAVKVQSQDNNIKDLFNIYFKQSYSSLNPIEQDDKSIINTPVLNTTLDKCYYVSDTKKQAVTLSMQALLFNKAYVQGEQGGTIQVPVYTPIIDSSNDLSPLGIKFINLNGNIKLGFESAIALCHRRNDFSATRLLSDGDLNFYAAEIDDNKYQYDGDGKMVDPAISADFLNKVWGNIGPNMLTFFPVYLGGHYGSEGTGHYNAVGGTISNYIPTTGWRYKNLIGKDTDVNKRNSRLTESTFDIKGTNLEQMKMQNSISFLGVKYKNGFTVLNTAFIDTVTNDIFTQRDYLYAGSGYDNFAYQLYLLLTNTYHKNKRIEDKQIKLKNYVRNGDYDIELIKHVFIHLKPKDDQPRNIIMKGYDFQEYLKAINIPDCPDTFKNENNVTLHFLDYAKDHELKILVNSEPMSFFDVEVDAYIKRNGLLYPVSDLAPNTFYVYQNGTIGEYSNSTLVFQVDDITTNLKYVFSDYVSQDATPKLTGVYTKKSTVFTDEDNAYNTYVTYIKEYIARETTYARYYNTEYEALQAREQYINDMFDTFPDSVSGYSKVQIRNILTTEGVLGLGGTLFDVSQYGTSGQYVFVINIHAASDINLPLRPGTEVAASYCEFATHRFLNIFDYQDEFMTSPTKQLGSTFGVKDGGNNKNSAYTGFAREVLLNTSYKVV